MPLSIHKNLSSVDKDELQLQDHELLEQNFNSR